jgi:acyl-CoA dehydrogenase family protein 9
MNAQNSGHSTEEQKDDKDQNSAVSNKNISFMRSLCMGSIEEELIIPFPQMKSEEKSTLKDMFGPLKDWLEPKELSQDFRHWDREGHFPEEYLNEVREFGLFGLIIPEDQGGVGLSSTGYSRFLQEVSKFDASTAVTIGAHSSIGMKGLLLFGTDEQKKKYLPKLATGEMIAAFCLTEAGAGSDAASIRTKATKDINSPSGDWILNGEKLWITNGGIASFFTVFARTETSDGLMTAFIVTKDMPGVSTGAHEDKMGLRASSTTTVTLDNVRVPAGNVLGPIGKGFKVAMHILNSGRTGLGGGCVGAQKKLIELASKQAKNRAQFGKPIAEYGLIKQKIGHMMVECYASESAVNMVAGLVDQQFEDYAVEAAISKVFATECLWRTVDEALQISGGNGFMCDYPYERMLRDSRINRIFEGTNDILRLFIALTAMSDVGAQLKELKGSLEGIFQDPIKGFGVLKEYALKRVGQSMGLGVGQQLGQKNSFTKLHPELLEYGNVFEEITRDLAKACDRILRKHGKNIIQMQFATKRLGDIMIDVFVLGAVLSRVNSSIIEKGVEGAKHEKQILEVFSGQVTRRVKGQFNKIDQNDDELIKDLADVAYKNEGFPWDVV